MNPGPSSTVALPAPAIAAEKSSAETGGVSILELYRQMWIYAAGARLWLALSSVMLVASQLVKLTVPWFAAKAIETLQHSPDGAGLAHCLPWVGGIVAVSAGTWMLHGPGRVIERSVALRVRRAMTDKLYERLSRAPLQWHGSHHSAELAHRLTQASGALSNFTQSQFIYLQNAVNLVGPLVALALLSSVTGGMALVGLVAVGLTIVAFDRALMKLAQEENEAERRHAAGLFDSLSNIGTVLSLRLQETTRRLLASRLDAVVEPLKRNITLNEWKWCAVDLLSVSLTWGLVTLYAWRAQTGGALMLGGIFMVYQYAQQAGGVIGSLASNLQNFSRMRTDFASADPIWQAPQTKPSNVAVVAASSTTAADPGVHAPAWERIDLCDLSYVHAGTDEEGIDRPGLRKVSLRLNAGERIALVGPSGSGKSTLLKVIAGLYEPSHGHVEIDGVTPLGVRDLRDFSTLIPQEPEVFEATVRENIGFDMPYTDVEIVAASRTGSFDTVLQSLPQGLDTPIVQGGSNLSGGQRQRLCLARGVLAARDSSVLLLDEPTSSLDPLTERLVYDRLAGEFPNSCMIASVHRMSLLDRFDRIVLLVQGQIVDSGTAEELLARQPLFREMVGADAAAEVQIPEFRLTVG